MYLHLHYYTVCGNKNSLSKFFVYVIKNIECVSAVVFVEGEHSAIKVPCGLDRWVVFEALYQFGVLLRDVVQHQKFLLHQFAVFYNADLRLWADHSHNHRTGSSISVSRYSMYCKDVGRVYVYVCTLFEYLAEIQTYANTDSICLTTYYEYSYGFPRLFSRALDPAQTW